MEKKHRITIVLILLAILFKISNAQQCNEFAIYQSKGENYILKDKIREKIKIQTLIQESEKLKIGIASYVVIVSNKDKILKIDTKGIHNYNYLVGLCEKIKSNIAKLYFKYIGDKVAETQEPETAMIVERAVTNSQLEYLDSTSFTGFPENNSLVEDKQFTFEWKESVESDEKIFILYENGKKLIYNTKVKGNKITLPSDIKLNKDAMYFWKVSDNYNEDISTYNTFVVVNKEWKENFLKDIYEMKVSFENETKKIRMENQEEINKVKEEYKKERENLKKQILNKNN